MAYSGPAGGGAPNYYNNGAPSQQPFAQPYAQQQQPQYAEQPPPGPPPKQQQQQTYAPPQGQPPNLGETGEKLSFEQAFKVDRPKYNDLWAGILLILVVLGFAVVSGVSIHGYATTKEFNGGGVYDGANAVGLNTNTIILFIFTLVIAIVFSFIYISLARLYPKSFIWITGILNIVFGLVTAIYMLSQRYYSGGIVFLLFVVLLIFAFITWIPRIPFSALMLETSVNVSKRYGHVYLVSFLGGLVATALAAWYCITFVAVYVKFEPGQNPACRQGGHCSTATVTGLIVFITFAMYWLSEWLKNTVHTTISGVYGSWYFHPFNPPLGATRGALKRSLTYSFGSISFGSLIVAILNFLRQICSMAQQSEAEDGNIAGTIMFCVLGCLIGLLDWAVEFLNRYAFSYIALYGKAYIPAAKDTWTMIKDRGIDALINECLIGPVLSMGATFVGYACAFMAYLYLVFTHPAYNEKGDYTVLVVAFAFLIGLQICNIVTTPISSGIDTIFVATAWHPQVLMQDHPELYQEMVRVYPGVQQAVHA